MPKYTEEQRGAIKGLEDDLSRLRARLKPKMDPKLRAKLMQEIEGHKQGIKDIKDGKY